MITPDTQCQCEHSGRFDTDCSKKGRPCATQIGLYNPGSGYLPCPVGVGIDEVVVIARLVIDFSPEFRIESVRKSVNGYRPDINVAVQYIHIGKHTFIARPGGKRIFLFEGVRYRGLGETGRLPEGTQIDAGGVLVKIGEIEHRNTFIHGILTA